MNGSAAVRWMCISFLAIACQVPSMSGAGAAWQPAQTKAPFELIRGSELVAALNIPAKNVKLAGALFIPASARRIRAVLVVI